MSPTKPCYAGTSHSTGASEDGHLGREQRALTHQRGEVARDGSLAPMVVSGHGRSRLSQVVSAALTISLCFLLFLDIPRVSANSVTTPRDVSVQHSIRAASASLLEDFQVYPPVLTVTPEGVLEITDGSSNATVDIIDNKRPSCQQTLAVHSFAYSYGIPFIGNYTPPTCSFNRVTWNLTVTSSGRQFDRLGIVYLNDTEVFRTTTAEPTTDGIIWTYLKDMTNYLSLFKDDQKLIFDLGNLITDVYTGDFNVTLTAAYFTAEDSITPADLIVPVSSHGSATDSVSVFTVPSDIASNVLTLPQNIKKAVFTVSATGQSTEEFWWSNVPQSTIDTFPSYGELYGYSPFREVQLFIDGMLAGVAWPFPVIFTGGVVPGLWRPIVGIDAFDLKEDEIDITPWLPLLCDGASHNFTIKVAGLNDNGNGTGTLAEIVGSYWLVTGKVFIWLDEEGHVTTGDGPYKVTPTPSFSVTSSVSATNGTNETLIYNVDAHRTLSFESTIKTSTGTESASWRQTLSFSNYGNYSDQGNVELNIQSTDAYDVSSSGYAKHYNYPLYALSTYEVLGDNISYIATVNRGKTVQTLGQPIFPTGLESFSASEAVHAEIPSFEGASLSTTQNGSAVYLANETSETSYSTGTTSQQMTFTGLKETGGKNSYGFPTFSDVYELFTRYALAENAVVVEDEETLIDESIPHAHGGPGSTKGYALSGLSGRGRKLQQIIQRRLRVQLALG